MFHHRMVHHMVAVAAALLLAMALGATPADAQTYNLTFASAYPGDDHQSMTLVKFAELAEEKTDGRVNINVAVGAILGGERDVTEGMQLGSVDGSILGGILQNFDAAMSILEFPFLFKNEEHIKAVMRGPVGEKIRDRLIETTGIHILDVVMRTPRVMTTNRPINSLADVRGLKLRVPEMEAHVETWRALGANPTPLAFPEIYTALQLGTVDGQENPLPVIHASRFHEVADYLAITNHLPGFMLIVINHDLFSGMPEDIQQALVEAAQEASAYNDRILAEQMADMEAEVFAQMTVTHPDMDEWREATKDVYKRFDGHDGFTELYLAIREAGEAF